MVNGTVLSWWGSQSYLSSRLSFQTYREGHGEEARRLIDSLPHYLTT